MKCETSCGAVVYTRQDGRILYVIVQSLEGFCGFPKGHTEGTETEKETALREIREETGLSVKLLDDFRVTDEYILPNKAGVMKRVVYFLGEYTGQGITYQKEELTGAYLMEYEDAMKALRFASARKILSMADAFIR